MTDFILQYLQDRSGGVELLAGLVQAPAHGVFRAALLQEGIDVAVILNALRALHG